MVPLLLFYRVPNTLVSASRSGFSNEYAYDSSFEAWGLIFFFFRFPNEPHILYSHFYILEDSYLVSLELKVLRHYFNFLLHFKSLLFHKFIDILHLMVKWMATVSPKHEKLTLKIAQTTSLSQSQVECHVGPAEW